MSDRQTRRQKVELEQNSNGHALANGHAKMNGAIEQVEMKLQKQENIFLFIPNIIGKHFCLELWL